MRVAPPVQRARPGHHFSSVARNAPRRHRLHTALLHPPQGGVAALLPLALLPALRDLHVTGALAQLTAVALGVLPSCGGAFPAAGFCGRAVAAATNTTGRVPGAALAGATARSFDQVQVIVSGLNLDGLLLPWRRPRCRPRCLRRRSSAASASVLRRVAAIRTRSRRPGTILLLTAIFSRAPGRKLTVFGRRPR